MAETSLADRLALLELFPEEGRVRRIASGAVEAIGPDLPVGAHCELVSARHDRVLGDARVVAVAIDKLTLVPFGHVDHLRVGDIVRAAEGQGGVRVGDGFAGRAIDALGRPLDGAAPPQSMQAITSQTAVLDRVAPSRIMPTGIKAIDGLLAIGYGARVGIFAASGVGKTKLVEQIHRQAQCQRVVVCLVGERGREVEALWESVKSSSALERTTLVAATSDESAPMRVQAVEQALALAEYWRDAGEDVLLILDSATRFAMALREIGLVAGEPPTVRAYTPGVFRELPRIVERCGAKRQGGSITAIFTVLSETDDVDDPIVEVMKSLLDGHIVLARRLAQIGHFPAIDVGRSISRLFDALVGEPHRKAAAFCRAMLARYDEARILIESGMYKAGGDRELDAAVSARDLINEFLRQSDKSAERWDAISLGVRTLAEQRG